MALAEKMQYQFLERMETCPFEESTMLYTLSHGPLNRLLDMNLEELVQLSYELTG